MHIVGSRGGYTIRDAGIEGVLSAWRTKKLGDAFVLIEQRCGACLRGNQPPQQQQ